MPLHPALTLSLYSGVILISALGGALVTAVRGLSGQTNSLLAFAAGVMLGAAFFHLLPEALHQGGLAALPWVVGGFVALLLLERFAGAHACEEPPDCPQHGHGLTLGLTALLGLCAHTLFDGIALGASVSEGLGLTAVTAITAHKLPSSLSLAAILKSEGKRLPTILRYVAILALMVPLGAAVYYLLEGWLPLGAFSSRALAFSSGTFLYIAVSDLLPRVSRHGRDRRLRHLFSLAVGLAMMGALSRLTGHTHG